MNPLRKAARLVGLGIWLFLGVVMVAGYVVLWPVVWLLSAPFQGPVPTPREWAVFWRDIGRELMAESRP